MRGRPLLPLLSLLQLLGLLALWLGLCSGSRTVPCRLVNLLTQPPVSYGDAWSAQKWLLEQQVAAQEVDDDAATALRGTVLVLEHRSVYTLGTATKEDSGPFTRELANGERLTYDVFQVERAGEATYHGPGQLVVYPILDLSYFDKDIDNYLRRLEAVVISSLARVGVSSAGRVTGLTGVWVDDQKVAAIGIKLRRWVTMHGVSINICPDMRYFDNIIPCGIRGKRVGSVQGLLAEAGSKSTVTVSQFAKIFLEEFCVHFGTSFPASLDGEKATEYFQGCILDREDV